MPNDSASGGFLQPIGAAGPEDDALDTILQALVVGVTGLAGNLVRPRWQPNPPPQPEATVNWCAIGVRNETPEQGFGRANIIHSATGGPVDGLDTSSQTDDIEVLASFYGPAARAYAIALRDGLAIPQNRETLTFTGLSLATTKMPLTFVPAIISQNTVRKVDLSLDFRRHVVLTWPIDNILRAVGTIASGRGTPQPFDTNNPPFPG